MVNASVSFLALRFYSHLFLNSSSYQLVERFGGNFHRCLETEREVGGREVVIDGFGNAHHVETFLGKPERDALRTVAADVDDGIETEFVEPFFVLLPPFS